MVARFFSVSSRGTFGAHERAWRVEQRLGLTGLVLGFALKDILSNEVSGRLILALRPFEIGGQIVVGPTWAVKRIELRAPQIRTYDGRVALAPHAEVFTPRIVNNTADQIRRGNVLLQVGYNTDLDALVERLGGPVASVHGVLDDRPVTVRLVELAADAITMKIGFCDAPEDCLAIKSPLNKTQSAGMSQVKLAPWDIFL